MGASDRRCGVSEMLEKRNFCTKSYSQPSRSFFRTPEVFQSKITVPVGNKIIIEARFRNMVLSSEVKSSFDSIIQWNCLMESNHIVQNRLSHYDNFYQFEQSNPPVSEVRCFLVHNLMLGTEIRAMRDLRT